MPAKSTSVLLTVVMCLLLHWHSFCVFSQPRYLAPEVLCTSVRNDQFYFDDDGCICETFQDTSLVYASSPRTDVWSLGIILLEFLLVSTAVYVDVISATFDNFYSTAALLVMQSVVLATAILSVCQSVQPSVTRWYCTQTNEGTIMRSSLWGSKNILVICPIAIAYSMGQIIKSFCVCLSVCLCVCVSVCLYVCAHSHSRISLSIFTKFDTEV